MQAQSGELTPDRLQSTLSLLPAPCIGSGNEIIGGMLIWTGLSAFFDIDPDAPQPMLERLMAAGLATM